MDNTTQKDKIVFNDKEYYINNIVYSDDMRIYVINLATFVSL